MVPNEKDLKKVGQKNKDPSYAYLPLFKFFKIFTNTHHFVIILQIERLF